MNLLKKIHRGKDFVENFIDEIIRLEERFVIREQMNMGKEKCEIVTNIMIRWLESKGIVRKWSRPFVNIVLRRLIRRVIYRLNDRFGHKWLEHKNSARSFILETDIFN